MENFSVSLEGDIHRTRAVGGTLWRTVVREVLLQPVLYIRLEQPIEPCVGAARCD